MTTADALAAAHGAYSATLPTTRASTVATVNLVLTGLTVKGTMSH